jgi:hypothetical protein
MMAPLSAGAWCNFEHLVAHHGCYGELAQVVDAEFSMRAIWQSENRTVPSEAIQILIIIAHGVSPDAAKRVGHHCIQVWSLQR